MLSYLMPRNMICSQIQLINKDMTIFGKAKINQELKLRPAPLPNILKNINRQMLLGEKIKQ